MGQLRESLSERQTRHQHDDAAHGDHRRADVQSESRKDRQGGDDRRPERLEQALHSARHDPRLEQTDQQTEQPRDHDIRR